MNDFWFEEELIPSEATIKSMNYENISIPGIEERLKRTARVNVRVQKPRWEEYDQQEKQFLQAGQPARYYKVKLGFEFELSPDGKRENVKFTSARCMTYLWAASPSQPSPTVYDLAPKDLREGERSKVTVKVNPKISIKNVADVSLGELSTDLMFGMIEPSCIGFTGTNGREPYWDLTPKSYSLIGIRHFWLAVEVPEKCTAFRLAVRAEAEAQGFFGILPLRGKHTTRDHLPSVIIPVD